LDHHPDALDRWYAFKDERIREEAVEWLIVNGIEPMQAASGFYNDV